MGWDDRGEESDVGTALLLRGVLPAASRVSSARCILFSEATEASPSGEESLYFGRVAGISSTISRTLVHEVGAIIWSRVRTFSLWCQRSVCAWATLPTTAVFCPPGDRGYSNEMSGNANSISAASLGATCRLEGLYLYGPWAPKVVKLVGFKSSRPHVMKFPNTPFETSGSSRHS